MTRPLMHPSRASSALIIDAVVLLSYVALPPLFALLVVIETGAAYVTAFGEVAGTLAAVDAHFFDAAGVLATVLLTFVAATEFGRASRRLSRRSRNLLLIATTVSVFLVLGLFVAVVTVAIARPEHVAQSTVEGAVCCVLLFVSHLVFGVVSPRRRERHARRDLSARRQRVGEDHYGPMTVSAGPRLATAEVASFVLPLTGSFAISAPTAILSVPSGHVGSALAIAALLLFAPLVALCGWRVTADRSAPARWRRIIRVTCAAAAAAAGTSLSVGLTVDGRWLWGLSSAIGCLGVAVLSACPSARWQPMHTVEYAATVRGLRAAERRWLRVTEERDEHGIAAASAPR